MFPTDLRAFPCILCSAHHPESLPSRRLGAVLVLLYEREGKIRVLLTTRSKRLRSHPGEVALPGGRSDDDDISPIRTALREANEEVSLPLGCPHIHVLRILPPFPSIYSLVVTPVVSVLNDTSILTQLVPNPGEVDDIFDHPLEAFLDYNIMNDEPNLSPQDSENWHYPEELYNQNEHPIFDGNHMYRNNRFRSTSMAVKGLTSSIMIFVAEIAFNRKPSFQHLSALHLPFGESVRAIVEGKLMRPSDLQLPTTSPYRTRLQDEISAEEGGYTLDGSMTPGVVPEA
ncbi:NUDIX hydrolase domain-like protein [Cantharellus anzutake]|uniref:NUDIX hydrolase domain-like protein n=1 Tax=Cantharellus anzutake TaxID=1750568 RepID=UPI0019052A6E|nr:NUDIX hydrolase domain-like protein [Cantharellus anzutake]KAF8329337.1 NUDIX hydrolase domain-like protein [Cantharellus anzutake]